MLRLLCVLILASPGAIFAGEQAAPSADEIMARVAANQDRAVKLRAEYVYHQRIRIVTRRTNGKPAREEAAEYHVVPNAEGTKKELKHLEGRYWHKGKYLDFQGEPAPQRDSLDGDLIEDFRNDFSNDQSKDGLGHNLLPLTSKEQERYRFELAGEDTLRGRKVYRVRFRPREKANLAWAGEALIDVEEMQPVRVFNHLSRRVPFLVRTLLGTDLPGLGFNVEYRRFDEGVWFPVSFGTEFRLRAVFFINRDIMISLENSDFERAKVESKIVGYESVEQPTY